MTIIKILSCGSVAGRLKIMHGKRCFTTPTGWEILDWGSGEVSAGTAYRLDHSELDHNAYCSPIPHYFKHSCVAQIKNLQKLDVGLDARYNPSHGTQHCVECHGMSKYINSHMKIHHQSMIVQEKWVAKRENFPSMI